ncbi:MAG TPA: DEAD/DEAH box helicase family protein, partial [Polyangiaceae bacterium]|nr:DEAD/DEAH box helicase family protein [Polyangiaceae bacterium]
VDSPMRLCFEHGTLVLVEPPDIDLGFVPGLTWDPRVALWRAPAHRYAEVLAALELGRVPCTDAVSANAASPADWRSIELRPYQEEASLAWELAGRSGIVVLPTGAGKTRVALANLARLRLRALCLVPTRALLHQWRREVERFYTGRVGCLGDGERQLEPITVATFESALRHMPRIGNWFDVLVIDEVHHFGNGLKDEALEMSTAMYRLGLTATPPHERALNRLDSLIGPVVCQVGVNELTGSWLSEFDLVLLRLTLNPSERARYQQDYGKFLEAHRDFRKLHPGGTWQEFAAAAGTSREGRAALLAWQRARRLLAYTEAKADAVGKLLARHRGARVLVFTANNETAYAIARKHLVMPITCEIKRRERGWALDAFRAGELKALVSARVLNEGIDVPDADVAIIVGGTWGEREHVQRVGRLLRPVPGKRAIVYELVTLATAEAHHAFQRRRGFAAARAVSA